MEVQSFATTQGITMGGKGGIGCAFLCVIVVQNHILESAYTARRAVPALAGETKKWIFINI